MSVTKQTVNLFLMLTASAITPGPQSNCQVPNQKHEGTKRPGFGPEVSGNELMSIVSAISSCNSSKYI